jgi:hypothetical protein
MLRSFGGHPGPFTINSQRLSLMPPLSVSGCPIERTSNPIVALMIQCRSVEVTVPLRTSTVKA